MSQPSPLSGLGLIMVEAAVSNRLGRQILHGVTQGGSLSRKVHPTWGAVGVLVQDWGGKGPAMFSYFKSVVLTDPDLIHTWI